MSVFLVQTHNLTKNRLLTENGGKKISKQSNVFRDNILVSIIIVISIILQMYLKKNRDVSEMISVIYA